MTTQTPPLSPPPPPPAAPKKPVNKPGRAAFIVAVIAFVLGCIAVLGFVTWIPAAVAVILAIIGLTRTGLPKGLAIAGLIIGIIALIAGPVTAITNVVNAVSGASNSPAAVASAPAASEATKAAAAPATSAAAKPSATPKDTTITTKSYEGSGDKVLHVDYEVPVVVSFSCSGCSGNTAVKTDSGTNTLIVNTIGGYSGRHVLNTSDGDLLTKFVISADAHWKLKVVDLKNATLEHVTNGATIKGKGDDVIAVESGVSDADVRNVGDGNFALNSYGGTDPLPVNEIGSYKGNVELDGPAVVQVTSDGSWSIKGNG